MLKKERITDGKKQGIESRCQRWRASLVVDKEELILCSWKVVKVNMS